MSDALLVVVFCAGAALSLATSWVLVSRLERVGARLGLTEALLGMVAALAADAPEIGAAVTALAGHQARIGAGVVIGSNVFNLAALLGLSALLAGQIVLHRRVIALEGFVAVWIASVCVVVVVGVVPAVVGLAVALVVLVPYLLVLGLSRQRLGRLGLPVAWVRWLREAVVEEETELEIAIHPRRGRPGDAVTAAVCVLVVVGASVAMEQAASTLGSRHGVPEIVVGGLILAAVTSLPNAVAAVYLSQRGRGAATLSTAMNSNALNVTAGLLLPGAIVGLGATSAASTLTVAWYLGLTVLTLVCAYVARGVRRAHGLLIISAYVAFVGVILTHGYTSPTGVLLWTALPALPAIALTASRLRRGHTAQRAARATPPPGHATIAPTIGTPHSRSRPDQCQDASSRNGHGPAPASLDGSLLAGWSISQIWYLGLAASAIIAAIDASLGHHVILIGLLIAGPCSALLTGRWTRTATAGAWSTALAIVLGLPDGIWGTFEHLVFLSAVVIVAAISTAAAAVIQRTQAP